MERALSPTPRCQHRDHRIKSPVLICWGVLRCLSTSFFVWALSLCSLVYDETVTRSGNEKLKISTTSKGLTALFCCLNFKVGVSQESKSPPVPICRCPVCRVHRFLPWKPQAPARKVPRYVMGTRSVTQPCHFCNLWHEVSVQVAVVTIKNKKKIGR